MSTRAEGKAYLGDAVYVDFDGFALWLTTEDGIRTTNRICLEPEVYRALTQYVACLTAPPPRPDPTGPQEEA